MCNWEKTAENIKILCIEKKVTIAQLSNFVGSPDLVSKVRRGRVTNINHFVKIAQFLGVKLDDFVAFDGMEIK